MRINEIQEIHALGVERKFSLIGSAALVMHGVIEEASDIDYVTENNLPDIVLESMFSHFKFDHCAIEKDSELGKVYSFNRSSGLWSLSELAAFYSCLIGLERPPHLIEKFKRRRNQIVKFCFTKKKVL